MMERVILVDEHDRELGAAEKLAAHQSGRLHRAVSVFVFDDSGRMLLQQRAASKYHSPGCWSNTCCGHPRPGETSSDAARRRLREEMGVDCPLDPAFSFRYRADMENGLVEHELDHVFFGRYGGTPHPDPGEVSEWRWATMREILDDLTAHPHRYTAWFKILLREHRSQLVFPTPGRTPTA